MLSEIEIYIIAQVRKKRLEKGLSQMELSQAMGYSDSFISHIEAPSKRAKYNINHLNELAQILECSPKDFWPQNPL